MSADRGERLTKKRKIKLLKKMARHLQGELMTAQELLCKKDEEIEELQDKLYHKNDEIEACQELLRDAEQCKKNGEVKRGLMQAEITTLRKKLVHASETVEMLINGQEMEIIALKKLQEEINRK